MFSSKPGLPTEHVFLIYNFCSFLSPFSLSLIPAFLLNYISSSMPLGQLVRANTATISLSRIDALNVLRSKYQLAPESISIWKVLAVSVFCQEERVALWNGHQRKTKTHITQKVQIGNKDTSSVSLSLMRTEKGRVGPALSSVLLWCY